MLCMGLCNGVVSNLYPIFVYKLLASFYLKYDNTEVTVMEIHERLRGMREDRDLNQTQIGDALHMSQRKVSYIENGE